MSITRQHIRHVGRDEYVISRLRQVLSRHKERGTWRRISKAIHVANGGGENVTIDRRTLPLICSDDEFDQVRLSLAQLIALDKYFVLTNEGPLFARTRSLVDSLAESSGIAFYVAAKYHRELHTEAVSGFDLRAITTLLTTRLGELHIEIIDVAGPNDWRTSKSRRDAIATVAIGSPIANYASDALLCGMLGFSVNKKTRIERLPFFIVHRSNERSFTSGFVRTRLHAIRRNATDSESIAKDQRALVIENRIFIGNDRNDYSLLVAQRNPVDGHVRAVLSGLSGIGTLELAKILRAGGPMKELPELHKKQKHPPLLVAVYKLTVLGRRGQARKDAESKKIVGSTPIFGPLLLHYNDGIWRSSADTN